MVENSPQQDSSGHISKRSWILLGIGLVVLVIILVVLLQRSQYLSASVLNGREQGDQEEGPVKIDPYTEFTAACVTLFNFCEIECTGNSFEHQKICMPKCEENRDECMREANSDALDDFRSDKVSAEEYERLYSR